MVEKKLIQMTDIKGIKVGHAQDYEGGSGCTVILCEGGAVAGCDVRGGGPASRETELLKPVNTNQEIHAVMLSGGSAFGLDAGAGAMQYLEERGIGVAVNKFKVPIVVGASIFDLPVGDSKCRPDKIMGYQACLNASDAPIPEGVVGAGTGASIGKICGYDRAMKSGLGTYGIQIGNLQVAAIVSVNAVGDVYDVDTWKMLGGVLSEDGKHFSTTEEEFYVRYLDTSPTDTGNTTIGCIVTNAKLTKSQINKIAMITHNGFARAIRPVHTTGDGDTIFALATGEVEANVDTVGVMATDCMARAINRAVKMSKGCYGLKGYSDIHSVEPV